jgi:hypothetical protein
MDKFISELRSMSAKVDKDVEELEKKADVLKYRFVGQAGGDGIRFDPEPDEYLVQCLEDVRKMKDDVDRIDRETETANKMMNNFRRDVEEQFAGVVAHMKGSRFHDEDFQIQKSDGEFISISVSRTTRPNSVSTRPP